MRSLHPKVKSDSGIIKVICVLCLRKFMEIKTTMIYITLRRKQTAFYLIPFVVLWSLNYK